MNNQNTQQLDGLEGIGDMLTSFMAMGQGIPMKDLIDIDQEALEGIYAAAYNYYSHGKYKKAQDAFEALIALNPFDVRFVMGVAATLQMQKEYKDALGRYGTAVFMDPDATMPALVYMAECLIPMGEKEHALELLDTFLEDAPKGRDMQDLRRRAQELKKRLGE